MQLSLLLFILSIKLKMAARSNAAFKSYIGNIHLRILIKTADGRYGRVFIFNKGRVASLGGAAHVSDAALVWSDPATAFKVMVSMSEEATFQAAAAGKVRVEGMAYFIQWFNDGIKLIM